MPVDESDAGAPDTWSEWKDLVRAVGQFGLSEKQAALYLAVLRRKQATARELAREVGVDRVLGYRLLEGMRDHGWVEMTLERPRRFVATPPRVLFERVLQQRREVLALNERLAETLPPVLDRLGDAQATVAPRYQIVAGTNRAYAHFREMLSRAREEIAVLSTARGLRDSFAADIHYKLGPFLARGGRFRLIAESDAKIQGLLKRFQGLSARFPKAEVRQLLPQPSRLTIVDRSEAFMFLVPDAHLRELDQIAVWTNHPDFVSGQVNYFNAMWETSGSGSILPPRPRGTNAARRRRTKSS